MDAIETLKAQTREKFGLAIADASADFNTAIASSRKRNRELALKEMKSPRSRSIAKLYWPRCAR